ncbi:MAG: GtrA family protein [Bacteroidales bacterium]|nr:GtrA family protein [Bacteroidales bacterium]
MMSSRLIDLFKRFIGYVSVSLIGTAVDTAVLWVCSHLLFSGSYFGRNILSPTISFECAVFVNFCSCYFFVWKDRISQRGTRSFFRHYAGYNASCTGAFLLKMGLLQLVLWITGLDVVWCNLIALCFSGLFNFTMSDRVIFRKKKTIFPDASLDRTGNPAADSEA